MMRWGAPAVHDPQIHVDGQHDPGPMLSIRVVCTCEEEIARHGLDVRTIPPGEAALRAHIERLAYGDLYMFGVHRTATAVN